MAVNLSPRCLVDPELPTHVLDVLRRHDVPAHQLILEITENMLAQDPTRAVTILTALHRAGIRISIDDFGTGYSSMSYLKRLPVDELKVDRSFVAHMVDDEADGVLVRSIIELGHNLGLTVVAEGVENAKTLAAIRALGCDVVQGYLLGRPGTAEALAQWLTSRQVIPQQGTPQQATPQQRADLSRRAS
jgi:diguanylate cyclase